MRRTLAIVGILLSGSRVAAGQTEDQLKRAFEGRTVLVKLDMPGTDDGIDVYPGTSRPVDFPALAGRLKRYGTAVRRGQEIMVTKIRIKKDLIEFQLGGGGYGTFGDDTSPHVSAPTAAKSQREKDLEKALAAATDPAAKKRIRDELDGLRRRREREDAANRTAAETASQIKEGNIRQRRLDGGSRFNLRYQPVVPPEAMTPDGVMRALAEFVDFSGMIADQAGGPGLHGEGPSRSGPGELRKGLLVDEVDAMLGRPESITQRAEGSLKVSKSLYIVREQEIEAEFVEGVLVRFTVRSR
jgi:hypothetical protein